MSVLAVSMNTDSRSVASCASKWAFQARVELALELPGELERVVGRKVP